MVRLWDFPRANLLSDTDLSSARDQQEISVKIVKSCQPHWRAKNIITSTEGALESTPPIQQDALKTSKESSLPKLTESVSGKKWREKKWREKNGGKIDLLFFYY